MPYQFKMTRLVEFAETDMAGIMHFSNYFRYMEATEHAFFRSLGLAVHGGAGGAMQGWARVHAECSYEAPLRYQDQVEVHLLVAGRRSRSIAYRFLFRRCGRAGEPAPPQDVARGAVTVVCVRREAGDETMRSADMPADVAERIEVAPPDVLETFAAAGPPR